MASGEILHLSSYDAGRSHKSLMLEAMSHAPSAAKRNNLIPNLTCAVSACPAPAPDEVGRSALKYGPDPPHSHFRRDRDRDLQP